MESQRLAEEDRSVLARWDPTQVVTVDGPQGSGKSTVAARLASDFGVRVVEIGPIFRLIAWLQAELELPSSLVSAEVAEAELRDGRIRLDVSQHRLAAVEVYFDGRSISKCLWEAGLANSVRRAAEDYATVERVRRLCREELVASGRTVVVGREAGTRFFPEAGLRVQLWTSPEVGIARKWRQLPGISAASDVTQSEARIAPCPSQRLYIIDTTSLDAAEVGDMVSSLVRNKIGWQGREDSEGENRHTTF